MQLGWSFPHWAVALAGAVLAAVVIAVPTGILWRCGRQAAAEGGDVAEQKVREASDAIARLVKS